MNDYEKMLKRLKAKDGSSLFKHPIMQWQAGFLHQNLPCEFKWFLADGEIAKRHQDKQVAKCVIDIMVVIMTVEELNALLREANAETDESLEALGKAYNKVVAVKSVLEPDLQQMTAQIRQARMTTEAEMKATITWLTTVREFFLENKYEVEMKRLREFIDTCKEIQRLKESGILDAVSDLAITLALQEKK